MHICYRVTNCLLFYSEEDEKAEAEVVEVASPLLNSRGRGGGGICQGVSDMVIFIVFHIWKGKLLIDLLLLVVPLNGRGPIGHSKVSGTNP